MILTSEYTLKNFIVLIVLTNDKLLVSKNNKLFIYDLLTNNYSFIVSLPCSPFIKLFSRVKLLSRLLRLGVRIAVPLSQDKLIIVFNKYFFEVNISDKSFEVVFNLPRGNRPLNIAKVDGINGFENTLYFGEYFNNFQRDKVNVYKRLPDGSWEIVYTFPEETIEHIHAIIPDDYRECLWILTGDFDKASGIWMVKDNFNEVKPILINNQKFRACVAFPELEGLVYATDSQFENNSIRLLRKKNDEWVSDLICEINGPAIYGCKVKSDLFFSTSVEGYSISKNFISKYLDRKPGPGIIENASHIVGGNLKNGFNILHKNKKDFFPFILFQFGAITFPTGRNETNHLFGYNIGLKKNDLDSEIFNIKT